MITRLKTTLGRHAVIEDALGCAALVALLYLSLHLPGF